MKMECKHTSKSPLKSNHPIDDVDKDSVLKWNHLGKHLNDFWEDLYDDYLE